ncbi:MAG: gliding motility-associated C-terminal domain-containing protein [Chitinophagaceae bacterium]
MYKVNNLTLLICLQLLLLFFSDQVFSQSIPPGVRKGNQVIFYGPHIKKDTVYTSQVKIEKKVPSKIADPFAINTGSDHDKVNNDNKVNQKPSGTSAVINLAITTQQPSCGYNDGAIIVQASGGVPPYIYDDFNSGPQNTGNFPMRSAGVYDITVKDANGNIATAKVTLTNTLSPPKIRIVSYTNTSACTAADATVTLEASEGVPPYQYSMDRVNFQASNVFTGFTAGSYIFFVKDANGCIGQVSPTYFFVNPACDGGYGFSYSATACGNNGLIYSSTNYPNPPYTYSMDGINYIASGQFENLTAGIYPVYFKDALGNVRVFAVTIYPHCAITINYITVDAACKQNDGILTVTADNGAAPYTYTIDGINYQASNVFAGLAPGVYFITAKDANGVTNSLGAEVYDRCPFVTAAATGETCAKNDGTITATATKGTAPYQYSINGVNFQPGNVFTGLLKGTYTVALKDALGFTSTTKATVGDDCVTVTAVATDATCGNDNGTITATVTRGTAPFLYSLDGIVFQADNIFPGVKGGTYTVTVKDFSGQRGTAIVTVNDTPGPQINLNTTPASCSNNDGTITVTATGGKLPFQYSIDGNNFQAGNVFKNRTSADYTVWIQDANQCLVSATIRVLLNCPVVTAVGKNETCDSRNGTITATATNGTGPYQYSIDGINFQSGDLFIGITAGTYTVTVKDALNSTNTTTVTIKNICPTVSVVVNDGLCTTANGKITASAANGTAPYQYSIDGINFKVGNTFTGHGSATYTITVKDANGLTNTTSAIVKNFPGPQITTVSSPASCLNNDGSINVMATGGVSPLQFNIAGRSFQPSPVFNSLPAADYTAMAKDANGCTASQGVTVDLNRNLTLATGADITICEGESIILPATSNGSAFSWSPSVSVNNSGLLNPAAVPANTTKYIVTATLGICTQKDSVTVLVNPAPVANAGKDSAICFGQDIQLTGSGGLHFKWSPSTYLDDPLIDDPVARRPLQTITYYLQVTGANGCQSLQPSLVTISVTPVANVFAGNDTSIVMNEPFQLLAKDINNSGFTKFTWSPSRGLNSAGIQNPIATLEKEIIYTVTAATDAGCQGSDEIRIKVYKGPEIYVPAAFTPNNDGKNDVLKAIPVGIREFKYFMVYNRWGQQVFYTTNPANGWDGSYKNGSQDTNTFIWIAGGTDSKGNTIKRKGTVTLIR